MYPFLYPFSNKKPILQSAVCPSLFYIVKYCMRLKIFLQKVGPLKGLSHEINFKNVDENGQILALLRAAAGFKIFRRLL
jgi:hypothetical protein